MLVCPQHASVLDVFGRRGGLFRRDKRLSSGLLLRKTVSRGAKGNDDHTSVIQFSIRKVGASGPHRCGLTKPGPQIPSPAVTMRVRSRTNSRSR